MVRDRSSPAAHIDRATPGAWCRANSRICIDYLTAGDTWLSSIVSAKVGADSLIKDTIVVRTVFFTYYLIEVSR